MPPLPLWSSLLELLLDTECFLYDKCRFIMLSLIIVWHHFSYLGTKHDSLPKHKGGGMTLMKCISQCMSWKALKRFALRLS